MRTYQKIIAGVLVLAGLVGLYGCAKKPDNKEITNKTNQTTSIETITNSNNQTSSIETIIESDDQTPSIEITTNNEHEKLVAYLTPKLKRVKESLYAELSKGNLGVIEYQQKTYQLLCEEGIISDKNKSEDFFEISVQLNRKIPTKTYKGLEKTYIVLEDVALSTEAKEDCEKYIKLKGMTYDYLKKELGNKPILMSEFITMVEGYLMKQNEPQGVTKQVWSIVFDLNREFNIIYYNPERSGGYPPEVLEEILNNL